MGLVLALPVSTHTLQQAHRTHHVGLNEIFRSVNGAIHMTLGCKVEHGTGLVLGQELGQQRRIANVALYKTVAWVVLYRSQVFQIARIGELVKGEYRLVGLRQPVEHKVGANKASTAG